MIFQGWKFLLIGQARRGLDDAAFIGVEDTIGEPVLAEVLPDIFGGIELRGLGWQRHEGAFSGMLNEFGSGVPCGLVEQHDGRDPAFGATARLISSRCRSMASVLARGMTSAAIPHRARGRWRRSRTPKRS